MDFPIGDHLDSNTENKWRDIPAASACSSLGFLSWHVSFLPAPKPNFSSLLSLQLQSPGTSPRGSGLTHPVDRARRLQFRQDANC